MNYEALCQKREQLKEVQRNISKRVLETFDKEFEIEYTHNSTAIEGNTLTFAQVNSLLTDGVFITSKIVHEIYEDDNVFADEKTRREIYEVVNHQKAFDFVKRCVVDGTPLNEKITKDIHALLMKDILTGGVYRMSEVRISGAKHKPPAPYEMYQQIKNFYADMSYRAESNAVELAAWTHAEFVKIHSYMDGNGRTSRMIMNYQLMANGFLPISIAEENRLEYFKVLDAYAVNGDLQPFMWLRRN